MKTLRVAKWKWILLILLLSGSYSILGQTVTGVVSDDQGVALPGVSVVIKGTQTGSISDVEGRFTVKVQDITKDVLIFSFVGMETLEVPVNGKSELSVTLSAQYEMLEELVVVGYGTMKKKDLTGSVASVSSKQLKDIPVTSAAQAITGRLAGVQITTSEGSPDAEIKIRVRGGGSITQDNSPLYIVDGFPVENISDIAPSDIESIDVLKDASSTAIYGSRGANGVINITTKSGKSGRTRISYNGYYGMKKLANSLDVLDPYEYVLYQYERNQSTFQERKAFASIYGTWEQLDTLYRDIEGTNWQNEVFGRVAPTTYHNLGVQGGGDRNTYSLSLTNNVDEGIMIESGYTRNNLNFRFDSKASERLNISFDVKVSDILVSGAGTSDPGTSSSNSLKHSVIYMPTSGLYDIGAVTEQLLDDASYYELTNLTDPVTLAQDQYRRTHTSTYNFNGAAEYTIVKGLSFRTEVGYNTRNEERRVYDGVSTPNARKYGDKPIASIEERFYKTTRMANTLNYSFTNDNNRLVLLLGQEMIVYKYNRLYTLSRGFPLGVTPEVALGSMGLGTDVQNPVTDESTSKLLSYFGRVNYTLKDRYLFSATVRADGSSKFGPKNRWGVFPSFSGAWRLSEEEFMKNISFLSYTKLRVSYGQAGNNRIDDMLWRSLMKVGTDKVYYLNESIVSFFYPDPDNIPNPYLQWETTITRGLGLDLGFLKNRLTANIDLYQNTGRNLLLQSTVPPETGYEYQMTNIGTTTNKGIELVLDAVLVEKGDLQLNMNFNIGFNQNRVDDLGGDDYRLENSGWNNDTGADFLVQVGQPVGLIYGFVTDGFYTVDDFVIDDATGELAEDSQGNYILKEGVADNSDILYAGFGPGAVKFADLADPVDEDGNPVPDGNKVTFDADRTVIGNTNPKHIGGINFSMVFKGIDASIFFNWVYGNDVYNANKIEFSSAYRKYTNLLSDFSSEYRWTNIDENGVVITDAQELADRNADATIWSPNTGRYLTHSWAIEDGSFLRLSNLTIGYTLPKKISKKIAMESLRVYVTGNNLKIWTNYSGYDPEVNTRTSTPLTPSVDYSAYPRSKMILAGVNVTF